MGTKRMTFMKVLWLHKQPSDPVEFYLELDEARWEIRRVEVFADGSMTLADDKKSTGTAELGLAQVGSIEQIAASPEFIPSEISKSEFESIWSRATARGPRK